MYIKVGENSYELKTTLGISLKLEKKTKKTLIELLTMIDKALILELIELLSIGAGKENDEEFKDALLENWDYAQLQLGIQEFLVKLMFSGNPEQAEAKLKEFPMPENQKNEIRGLLGIPKAPTNMDLTGNE